MDNFWMNIGDLIQITIVLALFLWLSRIEPRSIRSEWRERVRRMLPPLDDEQPIKAPDRISNAKHESNGPTIG